MSAPLIDIRSEGVADAMSYANWDKASGDVTNTVYQDKLADSLLDAPSLGSVSELHERTENSFENDEPMDYEAEAQEGEQEPQQRDYSAEREAFRAQQEKNQILDEAEASLREQEQQAQQVDSITPQALESARQWCLQALAENQDIVDSATHEYSQFSGLPPEQVAPIVHGEMTIGLGVLGACEQADWDMAKVTLQPAQLVAIHDGYCRMRGIQPRSSGFNREGLGRDIAFGIANVFSTIRALGPGATVEDVNDNAAWAVQYLNGLNWRTGLPSIDQELSQSLGRQATTQEVQQYAIGHVDAMTKPLLALYQRREAALAQSQTTQPRASRQNRRASPEHFDAKGKRISTGFNTNADLFDGADEIMRQATGKL
jgi:hypothetical protein